MHSYWTNFKYLLDSCGLITSLEFLNANRVPILILNIIIVKETRPLSSKWNLTFEFSLSNTVFSELVLCVKLFAIKAWKSKLNPHQELQSKGAHCMIGSLKWIMLGPLYA